MESFFVHLHVHTEYSLHDGLASIPSLIEKAVRHRMPAIAMTDYSNLFAAVKFYQQAIAAGIKPIIGTEIEIIHDGNATTTSHLTLLCQTNEGYQNLISLLSQTYLTSQHTGKPLVQTSWLTQEKLQGLIALSGAEEGDIGQALLSQNEDAAIKCLHFWQTVFPNRFYLEVKRIGNANEHLYIKQAVKLAETFSIPLIATNGVRFLNQSDFEAHEARVCIQSGITLNDPRRPRLYTDQQYLRSQAEMHALFSDIKEAVINTVEVAKRCNVHLNIGTYLLPHFKVPQCETAESYLSKAAKEGLETRLKKRFDTTHESFAQDRCAYDKRLSEELTVINNMGFAGYFLIVADFIQWAKDNQIPVGPGRGSGPGSLVAYALNITDLDPIELELLFERFLNPERVSMPDFDIDFCMEGRDRVIEYVMNKHGHESVSQIITYGTMAAKAVVRDVGRVLGLSYSFVDKIAKLIPFELGITLEKAILQEPTLRERYEKEEEVRTLIDLAKKLEGTIRNVGKHAGGIVIAPGKLTDFVPLYCEPNDPAHPVTQFDKDDIEAVGLVKFDFLGLKTLTMINRALHIINDTRRKNNENPIDISLIPLHDAATYSLLKAYKTTAVFQLESHGMRDLIKRLQPDCFEDLIALVALFRPGPLQAGAADDFINRKHGRSKIIYPHPTLEPILRPTYGAIVYQEQVMKIAQALAGYTLGSADLLRKAMGKKKPEEMAKQREIFCRGAVERGVHFEVASHIFDAMEKFAGYGFNKSHSAAYALIAYQTAWLKAHYPAAFMAAVLSSDMDRTEKIIVLLDECQSLKLHVSPPDINKSNYFFTVVDHQHLLYGLGAIKGLGSAAMDNIIITRDQQGPFKDLFDFCKRVDLRKINKRVLEALIKSGSFDTFGKHRATLFASLQTALQQAEQTAHNLSSGQHDLLDTVIEKQNETTPYLDAPPWDEKLQLQGEKETLGFYLTGHPLNPYLKELSAFTSGRIADLRPTNKMIRIAGMINSLRTKQTKRGDRIAILTLDDGTAQIEAVCFSECFQKNRSLLNEDQMIIIEGEVSIDEMTENTRIVCHEILTIELARERFAKCLQIQLSSLDEVDIPILQQLLNQYKNGSCPIVFHYLLEDAKIDIKLGKKWHVKPTDVFLTNIQNLLSPSRLDFIY
ncbi:MAG: DNA polymerase III subunit alpha [Gammaproteobacteria bacterium RIFCSPHIGHO2_12_FULL_38_11]|nr:MAG: DNA polymerase III subunit alpha [Gammaproteobacteria bacterium RIFCSPHIGHO2_12_FULL_38_11]